MYLLGFSIFSDEQLKALKEACVQIIPIKEIVTPRTYHTDLWHMQIGPNYGLRIWNGCHACRVFVDPAAKGINVVKFFD